MAVSSYLAWLAGIFQIKQLLRFLGVLGCALTSSIVFAGPAKRQPAPRPEDFPRTEIIEHDAFRLLNGRVILNHVEEQFTQGVWGTTQFNKRRNLQTILLLMRFIGFQFLFDHALPFLITKHGQAPTHFLEGPF